ncbi:MAG: hypothetical protein ACREU4_12965, partial [Burkholderiales bacterium]
MPLLGDLGRTAAQGVDLGARGVAPFAQHFQLPLRRGDALRPQPALVADGSDAVRARLGFALQPVMGGAPVDQLAAQVRQRAAQRPRLIAHRRQVRQRRFVGAHRRQLRFRFGNICCRGRRGFIERRRPRRRGRGAL